MEFSNEYFMNEALKEAQKALDKGEVPVGAVVVCKNKIIARAFNQCEQLHDSTAHAEMIAITSASHYLGSKYLKECILYVTLEPCVMCAGAMHWAQLGKLVYGASDEQRGFSLLKQPVLHPQTEILKGIAMDKCAALLHLFFKKLRGK